MSTAQLHFKPVDGDLHVAQECLAPFADEKINPAIPCFAEYVQTPPEIMQR